MRSAPRKNRSQKSPTPDTAAAQRNPSGRFRGPAAAVTIPASKPDAIFGKYETHPHIRTLHTDRRLRSLRTKKRKKEKPKKKRGEREREQKHNDKKNPQRASDARRADPNGRRIRNQRPISERAKFESLISRSDTRRHYSRKMSLICSRHLATSIGPTDYALADSCLR